ncbi:MAG: TerB family tellurite resistance protein [Gammaproteobacteria bacterium]|nr:TerB family tellurite resistance protein [Gammaproteobacteria bacterium]MCP5136409.1 TerB family tellurite resistance protein [Gammaproteobacteria bacterium]
MLKRFTELFSRFSVHVAPDDQEHALRLATTALMLEVARADLDIGDKELATVADLLCEDFELSRAESDALLIEATKCVESAVSSYPFTRRLIDNLSIEQRGLVIERLWQVALADDRLDKFEEATIRKLADLLYVPHSAFIRAKHAAQAPRSAAGTADDN